MGEALAEALPLALAIALSPLPIIPLLLLLPAAHGRRTGGAFVAAFALGVLVAVLVGAALPMADGASDEPAAWTSWTRVALGVLLVGLAVRTWLGRKNEKTPAWIEGLSSTTPRRAFRLGLVLAVANPKVVVLALAAGLGIGSSGLSRPDVVAVAVAFTAIACTGVAVPYLAFVVLGPRLASALASTRDWLVRNSAVVTALVFVALGLALIVNGVQELSG